MSIFFLSGKTRLLIEGESHIQIEVLYVQLGSALWKGLRISMLSEVSVSLPAEVLTWGSFMVIVLFFFPPIFILKAFSGLAFSPVVQMFSSLHSFENNGLFAGHWLSLFKRNNLYPWKRERKSMPLLLCHLSLHIAPRVKGVSVSSPNVFINSFQILASEGHGQMQLWTC